MSETNQNVSFARKLILIPIVIVAILVAIFLVKSRKKPTVKEGKEVATSIKSLKIKKVSIVPQAIGYGHIVPAKVWKAIAQVSGRIIWKEETLNNGAFFKKDTELLRIDDVPLKLAVDKAKAEVAKSRAMLAEFVASEKNARQTLAIREQMVALSTKELTRKRTLLKKRTISASDVDREELSVLNQKNSLQQTKSELSVLPQKIAYQASALKASEANLSQALLNLGYASIKAPFDCRIAKVNSEILQYCRVGEELFNADWTGRSEVEAQLDASQFMVLMNPGDKESGAKFAQIENVKAVVSFKSGQQEFKWPAKVDRIDSEIDPDTRTVGVVASVDDTYIQARNSQKVPLVKGMFCSVILFGRPREGLVVVPRSSIHGDKVYVMDSDNRLKFRTVKIAFNQFNYSVIESGLIEGDELIVTDVVPAILNMKLSAFPLEGFYEELEKTIGLSVLSQESDQ